jgi:Tfp pilus assembly PilM family ATPase
MRSLGLSLRPDGFDFVLFDGNAKKYKVAAAGSGHLHEDKVFAKGLGKGIAAALKKSGAGKVDQVTVALPSCGTLYRELNMPFGERDKIKQVLKFEIESELYHLEIDDVVCDFLELADDRATSTLLVAVQPKVGIGQALEAMRVVGLEAPVVDMDLTSMAGIASLLPPPEAKSDELAPLRAVVHVSSMSSVLLVFAGEKLRMARALHLGWRELARGLAKGEEEVGVDIPEIAAEPVEDSDGASATDAVESDEAQGEGVDEGEAAEEVDSDVALFGGDSTLPFALSLEEALSGASPDLTQQWVKKITAEIHRSLLAASLRTEDLTLVGASMPGLVEALQARLEVPVNELDLKADPVAIGAALRGFNAPHSSPMNLRQEEYRYTQGLERIERPLTFALVSLITFFVADGVSHWQQGRARFSDAASLENPASLVSLTVGEVERNLNKDLSVDSPPGWRVKTDLTSLTPDRYLTELRIRVLASKRALDEVVGAAGVPMSESCLDAWRLVLGVLNEEFSVNPSGKQERWMIERLKLASLDNKGKGRLAKVEVEIRLSVMGDSISASRKIEGLVVAFKNQDWIVDSPILSGGDLVKVGEGQTDTLKFSVSPSKAKEVDWCACDKCKEGDA